MRLMTYVGAFICASMLASPVLAEQNGDGSLEGAWARVQSEYVGEHQKLADCAKGGVCSPAAKRFLAVVERARGKSLAEAAAIVNRAVNAAIREVADGKVDHWASPLETFARGAGDCEDFAIAKYFALVEAGFNPGAMQLRIARIVRTGEGHVVLEVSGAGSYSNPTVANAPLKLFYALRGSGTQLSSLF